MICPNCGHEMPEGHLLCENCGHEINMVPDFEPELENSIDESLSTLVDELNSNENIEYIEEYVEEYIDNPDILGDTLEIVSEKKSIYKSIKKTKEEKYEDEFFSESPVFSNGRVNLKSIAIIILIIALGICALVSVSIFLYTRFSSNYQFERATKLFKQSQYEQSMVYIERGCDLDKNNLDLILLKADVFIRLDELENARTTLVDASSNKSFSDEEKVRIYKKIIDVYSMSADYEGVSALIDSSDNDYIKETFAEYSAPAPLFSVPTGNYDKLQELTIESSSFGEVYYTLNGTVPSETNGILYASPIILKAGEYDVKAVYINKFNVSSDITSCYYLIDLEPPMPPTVEPESETYSGPITVIAECPDDCEIYYTEDGTEPDVENGIKYEGPIEVPVGRFNFSFISVSSDGLLSESVKRSYTIDIDANISEDTAKITIYNVMTAKGFIASNDGTAIGNVGIYSYSYDSLINVPDYGYFYKFDEYFTDLTGSINSTGLLYAVDVYTGAVYRLALNDEGIWGLIPL